MWLVCGCRTWCGVQVRAAGMQHGPQSLIVWTELNTRQRGCSSVWPRARGHGGHGGHDGSLCCASSSLTVLHVCPGASPRHALQRITKERPTDYIHMVGRY